MSHFRGQKWLKARAQEREKEQREEELSGEVEDSFRAALPHSVISLLASQCHHPGDLYGGLEAYVNNKERPYVYLIKSESCYYLSFSECLIGQMATYCYHLLGGKCSRSAVQHLTTIR